MKLFLSSFLVLNFFVSLGQLNAGDLAIIGYNTDPFGSGRDHEFTFITLADIPAGEQVYFTEQGWNSTAGAWVANGEGHYSWTSPAGGTPCGTVIHIFETTTNDVLSVNGPGSIGSPIPAWSLSAGDQVLMYQGASAATASPTFITGLNGNYDASCYDAVTGWDAGFCIGTSSSRSTEPAGLTNGVDCISLFPAIAEQDNARYNGTLSGSASTLRGLINDRSNWSYNDASAFNITPGTYSPSVTCSGLPVELSVFETEVIGTDVALSWTTESELNNSGFDVMHSSDGEVWTKLGFIDGAGTTSNSNNYSFIHRMVSSGYHYYQLIQRDWDGETEASPVQSVFVDGSYQLELILSPNPSKGKYVHLISNVQAKNVQVADASGRIVDVSFDQASQMFDCSNIDNGIYTVTVESFDGTFSSVRFVRVN